MTAGVVVVADIAAGCDAVWRLVGDFGGIMRWHPDIIRCDAAGEGIGMVRTAHFADGWITERLDRCDPAAAILGYTVIDSSRPGAAGTTASIVLTAAGGDTRLEWRAQLPPGTDAAQTAGLATYYRTRVGHLRRALGLAGD